MMYINITIMLVPIWLQFATCVDPCSNHLVAWYICGMSFVIHIYGVLSLINIGLTVHPEDELENCPL